MMIGTCEVRRISLQTCQPSMTGSMMSSRMTSGSTSPARRSPAPPSEAMLTSKPSFSR